MYTAPDSTVYLIHNVPFASDYNHTYKFATAAAQSAYFISLAKYTLSDYSYQRAGLGRIRVGYLADLLYDVNYMMFQNTAYSNKWFYAFVTKITYINDGCTELEYIIDVMQTWQFDWELRQSYIERQHSVTDDIGDSITPEPVQPGEYVFNGALQSVFPGTNAPNLPAMEEMALIIGVIDNTNAPANFYAYDWTLSGAQLYAFDLSFSPGSTQLQDQLNTAKDLIANYVNAGQPDAVAFMYMCPKYNITRFSYTISTSTTWTNHKIGQNMLDAVFFVEEIQGITNTDTLDGYTPKNNKLYTYPYNMLSLITGTGQSLNLRYEFFTDPEKPEFVRMGSIIQPVSCTMFPNGYKNAGVNYDLSLTLSNYPQCSWTNDAYTAYVAQRMNEDWVLGAYGEGVKKIIDADIPYVSEAANRLSMLGFSAAEAGSRLLSNPLSALSGLNNVYAASNQIDLTKGSTQSANALYAYAKYAFRYSRTSINAKSAKQIDDFFTRFGYAVNELGTPNLAARPYYTYIKTGSAFVCGSFDDETGGRIAQVLDRGITFWKAGTTIADYTVNNAPV